MANFGSPEIYLSQDIFNYDALSTPSRLTPPPPPSPNPPLMDVQRKPKGRPRGSKNKPKPPVVITKECESTFKCTVIQVPVGANIIAEIINYGMKNRVGVTVVHAFGLVRDVALSLPRPFFFQGPFNLLSMTGLFVSSVSCNFYISLGGLHGQLSGSVAGKVVAGGPVMVSVVTFGSPVIEKLRFGKTLEELEEELRADIEANSTPVNRHNPPATRV